MVWHGLGPIRQVTTLPEFANPEDLPIEDSNGIGRINKIVNNHLVLGQLHELSTNSPVHILTLCRWRIRYANGQERGWQRKSHDH